MIRRIRSFGIFTGPLRLDGGMELVQGRPDIVDWEEIVQDREHEEDTRSGAWFLNWVMVPT